MRRGIIALIVSLLMFTGSVWAQDSVRVRMGDHTGYSRVVFDWPARGTHTVNNSSGALSIKFTKSGVLATDSEQSARLRNIGGFKVSSADPFTVSLTIPPDSRMRHFWVDDRLVLDVYDSPTGKTINTAQAAVSEVPRANPPPSQQDQKQAEEAPPESEPKVTKNIEEKKAEAQTEETTMPKKEVEPVKQEVLPAEPSPVIKPSGTGGSAIILSTVDISGMAAFQRDGLLWLVNDNEDLKVKPEVKSQGISKDNPSFVLLDASRIEGGAVFSYKAPNTYLRGEGGGLIWRIVDSPQGEQGHVYEPVKPIRQTRSGSVRQGQIIWPLEDAREILKLKDPVTGSFIYIVTVEDTKYFAGPPYDFPDFYTLPSPIGLAVIPKADDLIVKKHDLGIEITRPGGLALSREDEVLLAEEGAQKSIDRAEELEKPLKNIYDLTDWKMGQLSSLGQNRILILAGLKNLSKAAQVEGLLKTAKLHIANAHGIEAAGFLKLAQERLNDLSDSVAFKALLGAAEALAWNSRDAFNLLLDPVLDEFQEVGYWRAYTLADLGDWDQAYDRLPESMRRLESYPDLVFNRMAPVIAEVLLRAGNVEKAEPLLDILNQNKDSLLSEQKAALNYLLGEAARQKGDTAKAKEYWTPLLNGRDDLYRAASGLAMARLLSETGEANNQDIINRLERLRYAWRGDDLETNIHYYLGQKYFEEKQQARALNILREAASHAANPILAKRITADMQQMFKDLFLGDDLDALAPTDAVAIYEQFSELLPQGPDGNKIVERLAAHLGDSGLHKRAATMLSHQINHRLSGKDVVRVGIRLAATQIMNDKPDEALDSLDKADQAYESLSEEERPASARRDLTLLRARALSLQNKADEALILLEGLEISPDVNRLRADIAWNAGYWDDAAEALKEVIIDRDMSLTRPLEAEESTLILHRAVALNLSDDRIGLANHREKYADAMAQTPQASVFDVISRPRQNATLADRETLLNVIRETDLFGGFLESYKNSGN